MCSDDVIALILALQSEVEILAITAVAGDVSLKQAVENTGKVLSYFRSDLPYY